MFVTVGLPFFNSQVTLERAVRSVFSQTHEAWELLLVDDGSSDGSLELARRLRDPRVRVLADGVNRGLPTRLNQIATEARHPLLARMDADDLMHPERLARQVEAFQARPELDVLGTAAFEVDSTDRAFGLRGSRRDFNPLTVLARSPFVHPTVMGRTRWFLENPYDPAYPRAEDRELWCRTVAHSRFDALDAPLFFYREPDAFRLGPYLASSKTERKVLRRYGPPLAGWRWTARALVRTRLKAEAYRALTAAGRAHWLFKRRGRPLSSEEADRANSAIERIRATRVPGWDD